MEMILSKDEQLNLWDFSVKLSKSDMVPTIFKGKPDNVFATILYGKELGLNPIISLNAISVIQGQVTLKTQTMNGVVLANHPGAIIDIKQDEAKKEVIVSARRNKDDSAPYVSTWNMEKAKQMGLAGKDNYIRQPLTMLRARALSEALRVKFADTLLGFLATEEMEDLPPLRNDPLIDLQQAAREDAERMRLEQSRPEDNEVGPLYLIKNGSHRGTRLYQMALVEIEAYLNKLNTRTTKKKDWEIELQQVLTNYLSRIDEFREMLLELHNEEG
jgi:hypothetical protein